MARQAMVPEGAVVLPNDHGTAPGLHLPARAWHPRHLPSSRPSEGTPTDGLRSSDPVPEEKTAGRERPECRIYRVVGMGESLLEATVGLTLSGREDLEVGYCARPNEVDFRLIGSTSVLDEVEPLVLAAVGDHLLPAEHDSMEESVVRLLVDRGCTLATAESCTGGLLANRITDVPGSSAVFLEGFVTYSNASKTKLLGVPADLIAAHGAVSEEVVQAMANGALAKSGATHALATTGIAGPGGGARRSPSARSGRPWRRVTGKPRRGNSFFPSTVSPSRRPSPSRRSTACVAI